MKRIMFLLLLTSAAFAQKRVSVSSSQIHNVSAGREITTHMPVSCVVAPSAVVSVPFAIFNTHDLLASHPQQPSGYPQIYWVPMMPNAPMASLASLLTVNNKTAVQSKDVPFTITTENDDKYIYFTIAF